MEKKRGAGPIAAVTVGAALLMLLNMGPGHGFGNGGSSDAGVASPTAAVEATHEAPTTQPQTEPQTTAVPEKQVVLITISENDYLCDNQKYTLEELMDYLSTIEGEFLVQIQEDNASLRASRDLTDALTEWDILYIEQ